MRRFDRARTVLGGALVTLSTARLALPFLLATACSAAGTDDDAIDRHPLGKADAIGSCKLADGDDACGGKSAGNCWCDDECTRFGDCCADRVAVCDEHHRLRRLVSKAFSPRATTRLRTTISDVINELVDRHTAPGRCDVVNDIARQYPTPIICALIGAPPQDWQLFSDWTDDIFKAFSWNAANEIHVILARKHEHQ